MRRFLSFLAFAVSVYAQAPQAVPVTIVYGITSSAQVFDNRSVQRQCNNSTFSVVSGTGSWSVQLEYADAANTGPWTSFGSGGVVTSSAPLGHGAGFGYHNFLRLNTTVGTTNVTFSCEKDFALAGATGGNGGSGTPGGLPGDFQVNVGGVSFGGLTPPIPTNLGGTGTSTPSVTCTNGIQCPGTWPELTFSLTGLAPVYVGTPYQEVPSGTINGTNATFTLTNTPNTATLNLYRNGVYQKQGTGADYTLSTSTITFLTGAIPQTGDSLYASYQYGSSSGGGGTITGVTAGTGLSGGGVSGMVTLNASYANAITNPTGTGCTVNSSPSLQYNGTIYTCQGSVYAASSTGGTVPVNAVLLSSSSGAFENGAAFIQNVNNRAVSRDWQSAMDNGNYSSNGIASAITACGTTTACTVFVPAEYPTGEIVPCQVINWYNFSPGVNPCTTSQNITVYDQRYGDYRVMVNPQGQATSNNAVPMQWNIINNIPNYGLNHVQENNFGLNFSQENRDGGININQQGYGNKSNWNVMSLKMQSIASGQHIPFGIENATGGTGDTLAYSITNESAGGITAGTDEGNEEHDYHGGTPAGAYEATITAVSGNTLTMTESQMPDTQGQGRAVIDLNSANLITTGTVSFIAQAAGVPATVYFSGVTLPTPTVQAQLGTAVTAPGVSVTVTPNTFTFGSMSGITTSTLIVVGDIGGVDFIKPTAVTSTTFTAVFQFPHSATATIQVGGLAGRFLDLTADNITTANAPTAFPSVPPVGTVRTVRAIMTNTASSGSPISFYCTVTPCTSATVYNNSGGLWNPIISQWQNISGLNGYVLYPGAYALQAFDGGYINGIGGSRNSDSMVLTPSNTSWTVGDTIEQPMGPINRFSMGIWEIHGYQPTGAFTANGSGITYSIPMQGSDALFALTNNWPDCSYGSYNGAGSTCPSGHSGTFIGPVVMPITGKHQSVLQINEPADYAEIEIGCPPSPQVCSFVDQIVKIGNINGMNDYVDYQQANSTWQFYSGIGNSQIKTIIPHSGAAGSGYSAGDTFAINQTGGSGATGTVLTVAAGTTVPTYVSINGSGQHGTGYSVATGLSTTTLTGSGSGLQVDITQLEGTNTTFNPLWFDTQLMRLDPNTLAGQPGCTAEYHGAQAVILDSQSIEPGAIITGGGSAEVIAGCLNNRWVVMTGYKPQASMSFTGQSGNIASTIVCPNVTQCTSGNYIVSLPFLISSTGSSGTVTVSVSYGDGYSNTSYPLWVITDTGVTRSVPTQTFAIHSDGSQSINFSATSTGSTVYSMFPAVTAQ